MITRVLLAGLAFLAWAFATMGEQQEVLDAASADPPRWGWEPCGYDDDPVNIDSIQISPDPPIAGQNLTVTVIGEVFNTVEDGAYADLVVKAGPIRILHREVDLCYEARAAQVNISCPVQPGQHQVRHTASLPSAIPRAKFDIDINAYTVDDDDLTCVKLWIDFRRKTGFPVTVSSFEVSPSPPEPGKNVTITAVLHVHDTVEEGAYTDIVVTLDHKIEVSRKRYDLCETARQHDVGITCPVEPGTYTVTRTLKVPQELPQAKVTANIAGHSVDQDDLFCLNLDADLTKRDTLLHKALRNTNQSIHIYIRHALDIFNRLLHQAFQQLRLISQMLLQIRNSEQRGPYTRRLDIPPRIDGSSP
ncbi:hypothetical protein NM688_g7923 [Phlebia brevispora]|uniref:Uncharacterized protein n=1 Tax=Phlebia brevispora TaxID=194682 RepID=A0ACC1RZJ5_9APHY|nr:hypothetical protein NM688_g7923 [Phlebia brevispora]